MDINFGLSTMKETEYLTKLSEMRQQFILNNIRLEALNHDKETNEKEITKITDQQDFLKLNFGYKYE